MTTERICKHPECFYYDKKAKYYCCGACAYDHHSYKQLTSIITETRKEKVMDKIKREWSYKTSDGKVFFGKFAAKKAKEHQKRLNFRETIRAIIPQARRIFNINEPDSHEDGETDDEMFLDKINDQFSWDVEDFECFLNWIIAIYLEIPELSKFFQFIEEKFDEYK